MVKNKEKHFINRELSWLEFNQRVLDQALDKKVPALERLKFLAITASNLDEFFMVRVGGLQMLIQSGRRKKDISGSTPHQQLAAIQSRAEQMVKAQYQCLREEVDVQLAEEGICRMMPESLTEDQARYAERYFLEMVHPVLTPMAVHEPKRFPLLKGLALYQAVALNPTKKVPHLRFALLPIGLALDRFITLPSEKGYAYMLIEDLVRMYAHHWFSGETISECVTFRMSRNADLEVQEDLAADLLEQISEVLDARTRGHCTRLEIDHNASPELTDFLLEALAMTRHRIHRIDGPLDLSAFFRLSTSAGFEQLQYANWPPLASPLVEPETPIFEQLEEREILLHHPYESFDPVVRMVEEAADDPDVIAIKQILYRVSPESPIVAALVRAAKRSKYVTVIVELKARFDEARNIEWAQRLERAGVQVIYGIRGLKTHAKVCVIMKRTPEGIRRYAHFGTGNYNEGTARIYTDYSYLTAHADLGADATTFFNTITGYSQPQALRKLHMSPGGIRTCLIEMIESEIALHKEKRKTLIMFKCNSLQHPDIIRALYKASKAGIKIQLMIRGICCLRPGVEGLSENISVISVIDRFLEHSRVYYFQHGGDERVFISSADLMERNLERRIELMIPIEDKGFRKRLRDDLKMMAKDTAKGRQILEDGQYQQVEKSKGKKFRSQEEMYRQLRDRLAENEKAKPTVFEPLRPPKRDT